VEHFNARLAKSDALRLARRAAIGAVLAACSVAFTSASAQPVDTGPLTINGSLVVEGPVTVDGSLTVAGDVYARGPITAAWIERIPPDGRAVRRGWGEHRIRGPLTVHGPLVVQGDLEAHGPITADGPVGAVGHVGADGPITERR
jgi:phage baseplate assembly protein gpV